ncbi:hypothetical protein KM043_009190 [Ampulex compressa]|nr:hypothetical protein KM043_009190 [Ampulex compressa]
MPIPARDTTKAPNYIRKIFEPEDNVEGLSALYSLDIINESGSGSSLIVAGDDTRTHQRDISGVAAGGGRRGKKAGQKGGQDGDRGGEGQREDGQNSLLV